MCIRISYLTYANLVLTYTDITAKPEPSSGAAKKKDPRKLEASLNAMIKAHTRRIPDDLSESLKQAGSAILQPVEVEKVKLSEQTVDFADSGLVDDGADFDVADIPTVGIIGDTNPSVWAAISDLTDLKNDLTVTEREFGSAKSQTRKRLKRIKV